MIAYRELNIKNCPKYIFSCMTNIMKLDTSLLGVNQISFIDDNAVIYEIEYFKGLDDTTSLHRAF